MDFKGILTLIFLLQLYGKLVQSENVPCNVRKVKAGLMCVCNATYCDTIERPAVLPRGLYYHYSTAKESPGFTVATATFINNTRTFRGSSNDVYITVNPDMKYQTFEGIGASFTAASGLMINSLPLGAKQKFIESYFGESGIEYSFARVPISASDFSLRYYTYDDVPGDVELKYFNLTEEDFQLKIPIIQMAISVNKRGLKLIGTSWTAPDWMKTNNNYQYGYIYNKYLSVWANYHLKFLQAYKQNGIEFWGLTQGNEPSIAWYFGSFFPIQNTLLPPLVARYWTKMYLGPLLKSSGFENIKMFALDDERPFLTWYMDRMLADEEAAQYIDGVAVHWYLDDTNNLHILQDFHDKYPHKSILYTEASTSSSSTPGGGPVEMGYWNAAERYIINIINNLNHWAIGYIDWNIALNEQGGPTGPANLTLDAAITINKTNGEFYKQPIYYALGHFSKFILPGSKKINVTINQPFDDGDNYYEFDGMKIRKKFGPPPPPSTGGPYPLTGKPGPTGGPSPTTGAPFPTRRPDPPVTKISVLASYNTDGSHTVVTYNPRSEPVNIIITDSTMGVLNQTVAAQSLNTFIYW